MTIYPSMIHLSIHVYPHSFIHLIVIYPTIHGPVINLFPLSMHSSTHHLLSLHPSIHLFTYLSISLSTHSSVNLSVHTSIYPSIHLYILSFIHPPVYSFCARIYSYICLCVCTHVWRPNTGDFLLSLSILFLKVSLAEFSDSLGLLARALQGSPSLPSQS